MIKNSKIVLERSQKSIRKTIDRFIREELKVVHEEYGKILDRYNNAYIDILA